MPEYFLYNPGIPLINIQQQNFKVDMSGYAGGVYLLQFSNGLVQKVVKE